MPNVELKGTTVNGNEQVTISFPWAAVLTLGFIAAGTVGIIYDATQDLTEAVNRLDATLREVQSDVRAGEQDRARLAQRQEVFEVRIRNLEGQVQRLLK